MECITAACLLGEKLVFGGDAWLNPGGTPTAVKFKSASWHRGNEAQEFPANETLTLIRGRASESRTEFL